MDHKGLGKRVLAYAMSAGIVVATVPPVGASAIHGTVQAAGSAWVNSGVDNWSALSSTRPLTAGDRVKTGENGYLLADLGAQGVVGLSSNAEVAALADGSTTVLDVTGGKVAFHVNDGADLRISAGGAAIAADSIADGFVEVSPTGTSSLTVETGSFMVTMAAGDRRVMPGQRVFLDSGLVEPIQLAGAYGEPEEATELPVAPPPPPPPPAPVAPIAPPPAPIVDSAAAAAAAAAPAAPATSGWSASQILGWTALAAIAGVVIYEIVDDDDDDSSPSS